MQQNGDVVHTITGDFGRWQLRTIILVFLCKIPTSWFMACVIYTAPLPQKTDYYCKPSDFEEIRNATQPVTHSWIQRSFPLQVEEKQKTDREFHIDQCYIHNTTLAQRAGLNYTNPLDKPLRHLDSQQIMPCDHFEHISEYKSLVTQFDLVCSRQLLVSVTQSFHALGAFVGGLLALKLLKSVSPKRLMLYGMIGQIICGNMTGLVSTFMLHVYYRCLTSAFCAFMYISGQVIISDITAGKARTITITLSELFSSIGLILLPGISIFFDSWSHLYVAISTSLVFLVFPHRWISDSPRWLLQHNRIETTLKLLLESAAFNNHPIPLDLEQRLELMANDMKNKPIVRYWSLWDGKAPRSFILLIHWAWAVSMVIYSVMVIMIRFVDITKLHVNTSCLGFAEMLGIFLGLYLLLYTRHRWLWSGYLMLFAGIITYFVWFIPDSVKDSHRGAYEMIFWLFLKLVNSASLVILTNCSGELVTPDKRPLLMASVGAFSRFWLTLGPFILIFMKVNHLLPITIFASMAVSSGALMCFLNIHFCNDDQPKVRRIPTPNTYRRKSSTILLRKLSSVDECISCPEESSSAEMGYDNPSISISLEEFWEMAGNLADTEDTRAKKVAAKDRKRRFSHFL
ncbi:steroid transmembrane transporter SLC22A24 [Stomoxys calcitrans]|uniref:steroid transmembrane transporter SLC22A24 n=1 Tax=Stomoxys calcitrans TaxID=35570 RepID=UPI0027E2F349|nr:steroid transmembrane transporter SLC22A24 [Stomoxys calcitrans]